MHEGSKTFGILLIVAGGLAVFLGLDTENALNGILITQGGVTAFVIGGMLLAFSKAIGVLEEIRDRLPEPEKKTEDELPPEIEHEKEEWLKNKEA